jgi:endonuclease/exonuclease/phosphatase family metal-dependent hydrolase
MPRMCTVVTVLDTALGPVRVMTTHLEYFSRVQRIAQAQALRALHIEACEQSAAPPEQSQDGSPFQAKVHTANAILCGDFNLEPTDPEYAAIQAPFGQGQQLRDSWKVLNEETPHVPTFHVHNTKYSPVPVACDFVFVSDSLKGRVKSLRIDSVTQVSDHQPVAVEIAYSQTTAQPSRTP